MSDILYNVKKVVLTELDALTGLIKGGAVPINITCDSEVDLDPVISNGEEKVLRNDDQILAIARNSDLLYGYKFKMKNTQFDVNVASLIEGGIIRKSGAQIVGYDTSMLAQGATMKPFKADIYVANYDGDSIKNYIKITLNKCTGKAPKLGFKKDFFAPEFEVEARENTKAGLPIKATDYVDTIPADDTVKPVVTLTSTGTVTKPAPVKAKSSKLGYLYLVLGGVNVVTKAQLDDCVSMGIGTLNSIQTIGVDVDMLTTPLSAGSYKVYAVDLVGNVSVASTGITIA